MKWKYIKIYLLLQVWNEIIADNEQKLGKLGESKFIHMTVNGGDCNVYAHSSLWMRPTLPDRYNAKMVYTLNKIQDLPKKSWIKIYFLPESFHLNNQSECQFLSASSCLVKVLFLSEPLKKSSLEYFDNINQTLSWLIIFIIVARWWRCEYQLLIPHISSS